MGQMSELDISLAAAADELRQIPDMHERFDAAAIHAERICREHRLPRSCEVWIEGEALKKVYR